MLKALPLLQIKLVLQNVSATGQASGFPNMELSIRVTLLVSDRPGWKQLRTYFLWSDLLLRRKKRKKKERGFQKQETRKFTSSHFIYRILFSTEKEGTTARLMKH